MRDPPPPPQKSVNDAHLCLTRFDVAPGFEAGWHTHAINCIATTLTPSIVLIEHSDGAIKRAEIALGHS